MLIRCRITGVPFLFRAVTAISMFIASYSSGLSSGLCLSGGVPPKPIVLLFELL